MIKESFGERSVVLNDNLPKFHEAYHRARMFEYSRELGADFALCIDADELMSTSMLVDFNKILNSSYDYDFLYSLYWYNVVGDLKSIRQDAAYLNNYKEFLVPIRRAGQFDLRNWKHHAPRTPPCFGVNRVTSKEYGIIHLQSINKEYYALKQLWYKHKEFVEYGHSLERVNSYYDPVVNSLNFQEVTTPPGIVDGINFDPSIYNKMASIKGYKQYILENRVEGLITFGKEFLN